MHCPCGNHKVLALGLCATCYTLKQQDEEYFGGMREAVLERDGYAAASVTPPVATNAPSSFTTGYPGKSILNLMLSLCPGCHAKIHRTKAVLSAMPPLLLELWREQHPRGHEQKQLDFSSTKPAAKHVLLFRAEKNRIVSGSGAAGVSGVCRYLRWGTYLPSGLSQPHRTDTTVRVLRHSGSDREPCSSSKLLVYCRVKTCMPERLPSRLPLASPCDSRA